MLDIWGTQWDLNSLIMVFQSYLLRIIPCEVPINHQCNTFQHYSLGFGFLFLILFNNMLYTLPMNINRYVLFPIKWYALPININGYIPFLINTLDTIVRGWKFTKLSPSSHHRQVLYFVNVIKVSISFPTSILGISYSVTFLLE